MSILPDVHGELLIVRPPVPATVNKAGANYKSEVTHLAYSPRRAYDEWLSKAAILVDGRRSHPGLADHEAKLAEIRRRATPRPGRPGGATRARGNPRERSRRKALWARQPFPPWTPARRTWRRLARQRPT